MSIPKNHHFVPQGYLKRLVKPDSQVHYAWKDSRIISSTSSKNLCSEIDGYKLVSVRPEDALFLDNTYKTLWEDHYDEVFKKLTDEKVIIIDHRFRQLVVGTVCSLLFRSQRLRNAVDGLMRQSIAFMANVKRVDGSRPRTAELDGKVYELEGKTEADLWTEYEMNTNNDGILTTQFLMGARLQQVRSNDAILVTHVIGTTGFISSDNPTRIMYPPHVGIVAPFNHTDVLALPLNEGYRLDLVPGVRGAELDRIYRVELKGPDAEAEVLDNNFRQFNEAEKMVIGRKGSLKAFFNQVAQYIPT